MRSNQDKKIARLQLQSADMLAESANKLEAKRAAEIKKEKDSILEAAYTNIGAYIHNKRVATQASERAMNYSNHFTTIALTEALTKCAKNALLLDLDEYAKLNPNYENEMRETFKCFLESNSVNKDIQNKEIVELFESIKSETPPAQLYLTEDQEFDIVNSKIMSKDCVNRGLDSLCRDVRSRVADIVAKDQAALAANQADLDYAAEKELEVAPIVPVQPEPMAADPYAPLPDPEAMSPDQMGDAANQPMPAPVMESAKPKFRIAKDQVKSGIVETLTINEANKMLAEGKQYNSTLALANAIKYITILETLDAADIVSIGNDGYNRILSASGVQMNPVPKVNIPGAAIVDKPLATMNKPECNNNFVPTSTELPEDKKEAELRSKISAIVNTGVPAEFAIGSENKVFEPFKQWKHDNMASDKIFDTPVQEQMYTNMKGELLTETQVRRCFEREGVDIQLYDFDTLCYDWHFKKVK